MVNKTSEDFYSKLSSIDPDASLVNVTQAEMMQVNSAIGTLPQFGGVRGGKIRSENRVVERSPE